MSGALVVSVALAIVLALALAADGAIRSKLVSRTSAGTPADGDSFVDASTAI